MRDKELSDTSGMFQNIPLAGYTLDAGHGIKFNVNVANLGGNNWEIVEVSPCFYGSREHGIHLKNCELYQDVEDKWKFYLYGTDANTGLPVEIYIANFVQCSGMLPPASTECIVAPVGLAYNAEVVKEKEGAEAEMSNFFIQTSQIEAVKDIPPVVYGVLGNILDFKVIKNEWTGDDIYWFYIDTNPLKLEVVVNPNDLEGEPEIGDRLFATVWLQGEILPRL
jgi:hypothetical protein